MAPDPEQRPLSPLERAVIVMLPAAWYLGVAGVAWWFLGLGSDTPAVRRMVLGLVTLVVVIAGSAVVHLIRAAVRDPYFMDTRYDRSIRRPWR